MGVHQVVKGGHRQYVNTKVLELTGIWVCKQCGDFCGKIFNRASLNIIRRGFCKKCDAVVDQVVFKK